MTGGPCPGGGRAGPGAPLWGRRPTIATGEGGWRGSPLEIIRFDSSTRSMADRSRHGGPTGYGGYRAKERVGVGMQEEEADMS